ncbi:DUF4252 domain-containing protein [Aeoliella mucimassa]|uniref:DUF4252 domain-containing protein n=1 Tax=Aeoliella mucimassa TaxID=2527972 RepID=A0A518AMU7_9BACT|nr:DUF4252 domain-containing protein [Aeoliella mucimassa]QDU56052.1 hypothetical protein Pan181_22550 [Aeoliella mucimassa]
MRSLQLLARRTLRQAMVVAVVAATTAYTAHAQSEAPVETGPRVSLDAVDMPAASVELDLGPGLVRHFFRTGDAVVAGLLEGLATSEDPSAKENLQFAAKQITSARELGDVLSEVVREVHIRVWANGEATEGQAEQLVAYFDSTLKGEAWEPVLRARDGEEMVRLYVHREEDSVNGIVIVAANGPDEMVALNVVGDLSPDNVQRLVSTATRIGVQLGLDSELSKGIGQLKQEIESKRNR